MTGNESVFETAALLTAASVIARGQTSTAAVAPDPGIKDATLRNLNLEVWEEFRLFSYAVHGALYGAPASGSTPAAAPWFTPQATPPVAASGTANPETLAQALVPLLAAGVGGTGPFAAVIAKLIAAIPTPAAAAAASAAIPNPGPAPAPASSAATS